MNSNLYNITYIYLFILVKSHNIKCQLIFRRSIEKLILA